ncbi:MAG: SpoIIE family protein phosphatase [Pseudomonadota bacterium]
MEAMPPGLLGAIIGLSMGFILLARISVSRLMVESAPPIHQPLRQFFWDHLLFLAGGIVVIFIVVIFRGVPLAGGGALFVGFMGFGFFVAIDMALLKEKKVISQALTQETPLLKPAYLYPRARKFFFIALTATLYVMAVISLIISRDLGWLKSIDSSQLGALMPETTATIFKEMAFVMMILLAMTVNIIYSYSRNLRLLFETETRVLKSVTRGDLSRLVPVATNDEFGIIAGYTNIMIHALRDRIRILSNLKVAKEVQKNLLPNHPPAYPGLDASGTILYCQEVGGDYFDYFNLPGNRFGVAVTDSSDHGVGSALHMTTVRALIRSAARNYAGPATLIREVNSLLTQDCDGTGRFTTVFFLEIDPEHRCLTWVRAGHEPGILFNPMTQEFCPLMGNGMALGVVEDLEVEQNTIQGWERESILLISSDGLKESRNEDNVMYGQQRIRSIIRRYCTEPAAAIQKFLINDLEAFRGEIPIEDDTTIVVIKLL